MSGGPSEPDDALAIRTLIENWAIWRDSGDFEGLATAWHPGGQIVTTWFSGAFEDFVAKSQAAWNNGAVVHHMLGGHSAQIVGDRAIAQTKLLLCARGAIDGIECDATCTGRFYDFLKQSNGRWALMLRQPIYEKDRLDPIDPACTLTLDPDRLALFPVGYRHLAYLQASAGQTIAQNLPGLRGSAVEQLYARGAAWLAGAATP